MKADNFFTQQEKDRIKAVVGDVETRTSGEIAVMVVDASDTYPEARILAGVVTGSLLSLGLVDYFFSGSLWYFVFLALVLSLLFGWLVEYLPAVKRIFTGKARIENQVSEQAIQEFFHKGLYQTRDDTGVLFFISLFERKVWVLADKGIYRKIDQQTLQSYADEVAKGIKSNKACEALCKEITSIGKILAEHFPIKSDDTNELDNAVIVG
ncbi:MAG: TPM domain-containing protein [Proteobacteria bacterium]|nr:TPM domain-containing protein [Pseudomonadota bacterium]MBU1711347.1 TPM domain-containing protein [Pseudomonadota bacterium]